MLHLALTLAMLGAPVQTVHDNSLTIGQTDTGGTKISAQAINTAKYTGWIYVGDVKQLILAIDYTNSSGTAVTMQCWSDLVNTTANGSGYQIHELTRTGSASAPVGTSAPYTWSNAVSGDEDWTWTVNNIPLPFVNCSFTATGGGAGDTVTVKVLGVSP